jgi:GNAT superfamily N-acetyltransferase
VPAVQLFGWRGTGASRDGVAVEITAFGPDDTDRLSAFVEVSNAARSVDSPWVHPLTVREADGRFRHGWDGEPAVPFLCTDDGRAVAVGECATSEWDNRHLAWLHVEVHPDHRRRGRGTELLEELAAHARTLGRTSLGSDGWDAEGPREFADRHGFVPKSTAINRRQFLAQVDWDAVARMHQDASTAATDYEVLRRVGATPDDEIEAVATMTASINDAPTDDLDIEDEVFPPERIRAFEHAHAARGLTLHRVLARHRETGELAGHTVVSVDEERPHIGEQLDTSVVAAHRGHRLGLLLKSDMNLWLREAQPQLDTIDTWNAASNDHMIAVNELLGYRVMGRELEFQKSLDQ